MTRRIDIPFLVDLLLVDEPQLMRTLNDHPLINRRLVPSDRLLNEVTRRKIQDHLKVGDELLPAFRAREDPDRARRQEQLHERLDALAVQGLPRHADDIGALAAYVAGRHDIDTGVVVQRIVGRMFDENYTATEQSYRASCTVNAWPKALPPQAFWLRWSGRLRRSIERVWSLAHNDTHCIHGTAIAMHNIVATLSGMRQGFAAGGDVRYENAVGAVDTYLRGPETLVRSSTGPLLVGGLDRPLRRGTLVLFQLGKVLERSRDPTYAFAQGEWNECPAAGIARKLLECVWDQARLIGRGH